MNAMKIIILAALTVAASLATGAPAQEAPLDPDQATAVKVDESHADAGSFGLHYQIGAFASMSSGGWSASDWRFSLDLSGLRLSRTRSSFGLGLHLSYDGNRGRLGAKGLWRTPLSNGKNIYFQCAPGIYLIEMGSRRYSGIPGYFLEAELGLGRCVALVAAYEQRPYEIYRHSSINNYEPVLIEKGSIKSLNLGIKLGQKPGVIVTALGIIATMVVGSQMSDFN